MKARPTSHVILAPFRAANYRTLMQSITVFPDALDVLSRYVTDRGGYPYAVRIRTPCGLIRPTLGSFHDLRTVNEIFCREDYPVGPSAEVIVDIGANIGISALYFLTRNRTSRVYCYEPSPVNLPRLDANTKPYGRRIRIEPLAVSDRSGRMDLNAESIGRYSGLVDIGYTRPLEHVVQVEVIDINRVLETVLAQEAHIDVLKIDTEGTELPCIYAARPQLLRRVRTIYLEAVASEPLHATWFEQQQAGEICRLSARNATTQTTPRDPEAG